LEATYDLLVLDPTFEASVEVIDPETRNTKTYWVGVPRAGDGDDDDDGKHTTPLPSFSPPFRSRPCDRLNPVLVAVALWNKFNAYEFEGVKVPPHCLPYKESVSRLITALNWKPAPAPLPRPYHVPNETILPHSIQSDDEALSCSSTGSYEE